jgi:hypothetical protein
MAVESYLGWTLETYVSKIGDPEIRCFRLAVPLSLLSRTIDGLNRKAFGRKNWAHNVSNAAFGYKWHRDLAASTK